MELPAIIGGILPRHLGSDAKSAGKVKPPNKKRKALYMQQVASGKQAHAHFLKDFTKWACAEVQRFISANAANSIALC